MPVSVVGKRWPVRARGCDGSELAVRVSIANYRNLPNISVGTQARSAHSMSLGGGTPICAEQVAREARAAFADT